MTSLAVTKQSKTHSSLPHVWVLDTEAVFTEAYPSTWDQIGLERCFQSISFNNADKFKFLLIVLLQPVSGTVSCWRSKTTASTLRVCTSGWLGSADSQLGSLDSRAGCYFAFCSFSRHIGDNRDADKRFTLRSGNTQQSAASERILCAAAATVDRYYTPVILSLNPRKVVSFHFVLICRKENLERWKRFSWRGKFSLLCFWF